MLTEALSALTGLSIGLITQLTGVVILVIALLMRVQIGWGTLGNILFTALGLISFYGSFLQLREIGRCKAACCSSRLR